jgi:N-acetyl-D-muramate 6-phosphate phosphatase
MIQLQGRTIRAMLFDFDGTLADTAPDLGAAMNAVLRTKGKPELPLALFRPHTSQGARGMIRASFGYGIDHPEYPTLKDAFLAQYEQDLLVNTQLFDGVQPLLDRLKMLHLGFGIITNKHARFSIPIMQQMQLGEAVLVCGDTTPFAKPHPEPLLFAAKQIGVDPSECAYVGDAGTDMQAAKAAGMLAIAAAWGYIPPGEAVADWDSDCVAQTVDDLLGWLR